MWSTDHHEKVLPYYVAKPHRHISLKWTLKKWIQKFSLKQTKLNDLRNFVKNIKSKLETCPSDTISNEQVNFQFSPPKEIDLIGSLQYYGICFNAKYSHINHYNVDISVTMPSPHCITLNDITKNKSKYLLKRKAYLTHLYQYLKEKHHKLFHEISIEYLNHDPMKPIIAIKPKTKSNTLTHCCIRLIPSINIQSFLDDDNDNDNDDDSEDDTSDEDNIIERIFYGKYFKKFDSLREQYSTDLNQWTFKKLKKCVYDNNSNNKNDNKSPISENELLEEHLIAQQILEDVFMKSNLLEFYNASKINPNLHRALVLIKAWWNSCNLHVQTKKTNSNNQDHDHSRFGDINSFHLTMFLLLLHRTYHIDKWDSPLVVFAKFLELISREEMATWLCKPPPSTLFEQNPKWYTSCGDSHLFASVSDKMLNNKDRASVFDPKQIDFSEENAKANANIYDVDNDEGGGTGNAPSIHYSYNIWKTKKKGLSMTHSKDGPSSFDSWMDNCDEQQVFMNLLTNAFPVVFTNVTGRMNYTFRVNRSNYLHFIAEARRASDSINSLLQEIPFMPNPEHWAYSSAINPQHYDMVSAPVMAFHEKCLKELLTPKPMQFWYYFDGFIKINAQSLIDEYCLNSDNDRSMISVMLQLEDVIMQAMSDRCKTFMIYYNPKKGNEVWNNELFIGLTMHTFAFREMILGPPFNEKKCSKEFKAFWGEDVVKNRRFPDGVLLNTVLLSDKNTFSEYIDVIEDKAKKCHMNKAAKKKMIDFKRKNKYQNMQTATNHKSKMNEFKKAPSSVILTILWHSLKRHLQIKHCDVELILDPLWSITPNYLAFAPKLGAPTANTKLNRAFERLEFTLKNICRRNKQTLPLRIMEVLKIDPSLWNVAIEPPKCKNILYSSYSLVDCFNPIGVVIKFETSESWPKRNVRALMSLKLAFFIEIHRSFKRFKIRSLLSKNYIDCLVNGYCFRCSIVADSEFNVQKFQTLKNAKYQFKFLPNLGKCLHGIASNHSYFSPTISLVKRWLHCNLFSDLIDEHMITCLVSDLFVNSEPYRSPQSAFQGFLRFLDLVSKFDWLDNPYIVDLGCNTNVLKSDSVQSAPTAHQFHVFKSQMLNSRMNDEGLHAMFVVVPGLEDASKWTKEKPTLQTLDRLVRFAKISLKFLLKQMSLSNANEFDAFLRVFKPCKDEFDFVINLNTSYITNYMYNLWKSEKGITKFRESQIVKRIGKLNMEQRKLKEKKEMQKEKALKDKKMHGKLSANGVLQFIENPVWELKKRTFEMYANANGDNASPNKKRKLNDGNKYENKFEEMIAENPEKFLEENELFVVGLNPVQLFLNEIRRYICKHISVYYDQNGGDFIGCKWIMDATVETQKTIFSALWEFGNGLVESIKINKNPSSHEIQAIQHLKQMMNVTHSHNDSNNKDEWTVVGEDNNI